MNILSVVFLPFVLICSNATCYPGIIESALWLFLNVTTSVEAKHANASGEVEADIQKACEDLFFEFYKKITRRIDKFNAFYKKQEDRFVSRVSKRDGKIIPTSGEAEYYEKDDTDDVIKDKFFGYLQRMEPNINEIESFCDKECKQLDLELYRLVVKYNEGKWSQRSK